MPEQIKEVLQEREKTHGDYRENALVAQQLKELFKEENIVGPVLNYTLDMLAVKLARIVNGNPLEPDHWKDISGYAYLMYMELIGEKLS